MYRGALLIVLLAASCVTPGDPGTVCSEPCEVPDAMPDGTPDDVPVERALNGLCLDAACTTIAPDVRSYDPRWDLWSDGATKRRWIYLPPGATIDTTELDYWRFPVGTKLWKEFVRDGVRVETRYLEKTDDGDAKWTYMAYAWNAEQTEATAVPEGRQNANGTQHDIPAVAACKDCHANTKSPVLGFSAFQLDYAAPEDNVDLDRANTLGWLAPALSGTSPHLPVPGNAKQQDVLGYLHANCGHCHNSQSQLVNRPSLRLETDHLGSLADTRTYRTTVDVAGKPFGGATIVVKPGDPERSILVTRMMSSDPTKRMPWLGGEIADPAGLALLRAWITTL